MTEREWLLQQAERYDALELAEAEAIEQGRGSDGMCTYYRKLAEHQRFLACNADDTRQVDSKGRVIW